MSDHSTRFDVDTSIDDLPTDQIQAYSSWALAWLTSHDRTIPIFGWGLPVSDSSKPLLARARQLQRSINSTNDDEPDHPLPIAPAIKAPTPAQLNGPLPYTPAGLRHVTAGSSQRRNTDSGPRSVANRSAGLSQPRTFLGRLFSSSWTRAMSSAVWTDKSVLLGK